MAKGPQCRRVSRDAALTWRCVRLALADLRVGQVWGEVTSIRSGQPASALRMRGLAGPYIPRLVCRQGPPDFESGLAT
jgi:hypothetical protein